MTKTTWYFENRVLPKRTYLTRELCAGVVTCCEDRREQDNGRISYWGYRAELEEHGIHQYLRVITEPDGETIHNAYPDRDYRRRRER